MSHSIINVLRKSVISNVEKDLTTRKFYYDNIKVRNLKYKSSAKERRRNAIRDKTLGPRDIGEEVPPFFLPARYKLLLKCYQDHRNAHRYARKPIPKALLGEYI